MEAQEDAYELIDEARKHRFYVAMEVQVRGPKGRDPKSYKWMKAHFLITSQETLDGSAEIITLASKFLDSNFIHTRSKEL
jgi:hypothetical protein